MHLLIASVLAASIVAPRDPSTIVNGQVAENCAWPSVVELKSTGVGCSGTLVHPYIVATAAHCLEGAGTFSHAVFGESHANGVSRAIELCEINPEYPTGVSTTEFDNRDFAFCKLAAPVENVPIIPIAYGCELDAIQPGVDLYGVGFGQTQTASQDYGTKRFGHTAVIEVDATGEIVHGALTCHGDSGGAMFMQLPGGELRLVGIVSHGLTQLCSGASVATAASELVPFVFERTGIDIAPCHAIDGSWAPDGSCGGVPLEPHVGGPGDHAQGCPTGALSGFQSTCGPSVEETPDTTAPAVAIVTPQSGEMIESAGATTELEIAVEADDGDGWGLALVEVVLERVDGPTQTAPPHTIAPYRWPAVLENGAYYLRGEAEDYAGNRGVSAWVAIGIGVPAPPPREDEEETTGGASSSDDGESTSAASTGGESETGGTDSAAADEPGDASGCGCRSSPTFGPAMSWLLLAAIRRRRPR